MKFLPSISTVLVFLLAPLSALAANAPQAAASAFELPRLKSHRGPGKSMPKARATVDDLSPRGKAGAAKGRKQDLDYLAIDGGRHWSAPLHGAPGDVTFVSFFVYASAGTVIDAAGAKLMIRPGEKPGVAQLWVGTPGRDNPHWREFGGPVPFEKHNGKLLAPLPVLTVRLDPAAKEWDLFVANRLVAAGLHLPEMPADAPKQFNVSAGANGAWVCGLVSAEENPLYEDSNANGIDDEFERQKRAGNLLAANASAADRTSLATQWQQDQRTRNVRPWAVQRLRPDGAPTNPPGKAK